MSVCIVKDIITCCFTDYSRSLVLSTIWSFSKVNCFHSIATTEHLSGATSPYRWPEFDCPCPLTAINSFSVMFLEHVAVLPCELRVVWLTFARRLPLTSTVLKFCFFGSVRRLSCPTCHKGTVFIALVIGFAAKAQFFIYLTLLSFANLK